MAKPLAKGVCRCRAKPAGPRWRKGPPNAPGYWLVQIENGVLAAWEVFAARSPKIGDLLMYRRAFSAVTFRLDEVDVKRSFGPIRKPQKVK